jgi:DNA-binding MarR family transcriptional regulator
MISRGVDPGDARRTRLHLTPRGREIDRRSAGTIEAAVRRTLASMPAQQVEAASQLLAALAAQLLGNGVAERRRSRAKGQRG